MSLYHRCFSNILLGKINYLVSHKSNIGRKWVDESGRQYPDMASEINVLIFVDLYLIAVNLNSKGIDEVSWCASNPVCIYLFKNDEGSTGIAKI